MPERFLREPFRIAADLGALSPSVAVRMQRDPGDAEASARAPEFFRPVPFGELLVVREQRSEAR